MAVRNSDMNFKRPRKSLPVCADRAEFIDYKDVNKLKKCMTERSKILLDVLQALVHITKESLPLLLRGQGI